jgi:hypothetical protein
VERARATWTDERLDDLARRVDDGFSRVDGELRSLRSETIAMRAELSGRIDGLQRTMIQVGGGLIAAFLAGFIGLIATQV